MTRQQFGIVLVIVGTFLLAFAVKVRSSRGRLDIVGNIIQTAEAATISDHPAMAALGRPWTPRSGVGSSVVDVRE